ncbi:alpha/beta fold hydrolase [Bosea sp. 124]|uniref:alpha/beta fold hydrolase n=1 Tax=Bosea sp. 124 TaxID=2135642 RepID=UPI000D38A50C|nr:alpha/beta fold hydrolase [Bosea sp. 124]PTM43510.1 pimeloyl-ACP methyl ester carboxylesterase [Bosea sp. 124]
MTAHAAAPKALSPSPVQFRTVTVQGLDIFYREAGPKDAPVLLLLHGFPSSSHMFRDLIPLLAGQFRVIAPDYPGFGNSAAPGIGTFPYTFAALADVVDAFTDAVCASSYVIYMQDYGGPIGFRLALKHPERVRGFIIQNAVANVEGWNPEVVKALAPFWQGRNAQTEQPVRALLTAETTRFQYTHGASRKERLSPDAWIHDQAGLDRPGNAALQVEMLWNYQDNVAQYPKWQDYLKTRQPPLLIAWGDNDPYFTLKGAELFKTLVPSAELHHYDAGHFALETHVEDIAAVSLAFLARLPKAR